VNIYKKSRTDGRSLADFCDPGRCGSQPYAAVSKLTGYETQD